MLQKSSKCLQKRTPKNTEKSFDNEITDAPRGFNQTSQLKPGIEMGLYQQRHYQFGLKGRVGTKQRKAGFYRTGQCEDTERRQPSASQGERPQKKSNLPTP